jgi:hypothetical protein
MSHFFSLQTPPESVGQCKVLTNVGHGGGLEEPEKQKK